MILITDNVSISSGSSSSTRNSYHSRSSSSSYFSNNCVLPLQFADLTKQGCARFCIRNDIPVWASLDQLIYNVHLPRRQKNSNRYTIFPNNKPIRTHLQQVFSKHNVAKAEIAHHRLLSSIFQTYLRNSLNCKEFPYICIESKLSAVDTFYVGKMLIYIQ